MERKFVVSSTAALYIISGSTEFPTKSFCNRSGCKPEEKFKISFSASPEFIEKLTRAQELMFSGNSEDLLLENIFGEALELYIEKHCPREKQKRREARKESKVEVIEPVSPKDNNEQATVTEKALSRHIPAAVKEKVLHRDNYQCSYVSPSGTKCSCRRNLEIDHIVPFALGGSSDFNNLRVLCASHNLHAARRAFGAEFIESKIEARTDSIQASG